MNGIVDSYEKKDVIKIQSFVRGCLCRARVSEMVQKLIEEILLKREKSQRTSRTVYGDDSISIVSDTQTKAEVENSVEEQQPAPIDEKPESNIDQTECKQDSATSKGLIKTEAEGTKDGTTSSDVLEGSVHSIRSRFEKKTGLDPKPAAPKKIWSLTKGKTKGMEGEEKEGEQPINGEQAPSAKHSELPKSETPSESQNNSSSEGPKNTFVKNAKLRSNATNHVSSSEKLLEEQGMRMNNEIEQLLKDIKRVGEPGEPSVKFGELFDDEKVANYYEALVGTLKAAKKKKLIQYEGQYLLKGINDKVVISLVSV